MLGFRRLMLASLCSTAALAVLIGVASEFAGLGDVASATDHDAPIALVASAPERNRIADALQTIGRSEIGRRILADAQAFWKLPDASQLTQVFRWGDASRTDAVLTRHLNPLTGQEERERQVLIYLKEDQPQPELILDIAHELVHATARPSWDPYDPNLTAADYIRSGIDGAGGEVEAVYQECRVGLELANSLGRVVERCHAYQDSAQGPPLKERIAQDFYRVGRWRREIASRLGGEVAKFPLLSDQAPRLYSSTGHSPYPLALLREFEQLTQIACANSRKRFQAFQDRDEVSVVRSPASSGSYLRQATEKFLAARCSLR